MRVFPSAQAAIGQSPITTQAKRVGCDAEGWHVLLTSCTIVRRLDREPRKRTRVHTGAGVRSAECGPRSSRTLQKSIYGGHWAAILFRAAMCLAHRHERHTCSTQVPVLLWAADTMATLDEIADGYLSAEDEDFVPDGACCGCTASSCAALSGRARFSHPLPGCATTHQRRSCRTTRRLWRAKRVLTRL